MRISDWSSDVCSSDLHERRALFHEAPALAIPAIDRVRPVVHHAEGIPHVALVVDEEAPGIQRTGGNTGDPAVVGVELEQERIVDRTRDQHRLALVRQRIHDPVEVAVRGRDPAGAVDVRAVHVAQADLEVETPGDRKRTRLNSSHYYADRMPASDWKKKQKK